MQLKLYQIAVSFRLLIVRFLTVNNKRWCMCNSHGRSQDFHWGGCTLRCSFSGLGC